MSNSIDLKALETPTSCIADVCIIPLGTGTPSVSKEVALVQRLFAASDLKYTMHSAGTTIEGPWTPVLHLIGQAHTLLHASGVARIQSDIRVGSRIDKSQTAADKVESVRRILSAGKAE